MSLYTLAANDVRMCGPWPDTASCQLNLTAHRVPLYTYRLAAADLRCVPCHKDSTLIMQLLRDNLTLWTSDMADEQPGGPDGTKVEDIA